MLKTECYKASWCLLTRSYTHCYHRNRFCLPNSSETFLNTCRHYPLLFQASCLAGHPADVDRTSSNDAVTSTLAPSVSDSAMPLLFLASSESSTSSEDSSTASLKGRKSDSSKSSVQSEAHDNPLGPTKVFKSCRFDCHCSCHARARSQSDKPTIFNNANSRVFTADPGCNDPKCDAVKVDANRSLRTSKTKAFHGALSQITSGHTLKVRYRLMTFRMIPETSDIARFAIQGNLDGLKAAITSGRATIWDTTPDGWSLLHVSLLNNA